MSRDAFPRRSPLCPASWSPIQRRPPGPSSPTRPKPATVGSVQTRARPWHCASTAWCTRSHVCVPGARERAPAHTRETAERARGRFLNTASQPGVARAAPSELHTHSKPTITAVYALHNLAIAHQLWAGLIVDGDGRGGADGFSLVSDPRSGHAPHEKPKTRKLPSSCPDLFLSSPA